VYIKILRDGIISAVCVVIIFYILTYFVQLLFDFYKPHWTFALGLGVGNMFMPMWGRYKLEKKRKFDEEFITTVEIEEIIEIGEHNER